LFRFGISFITVSITRVINALDSVAKQRRQGQRPQHKISNHFRCPFMKNLLAVTFWHVVHNGASAQTCESSIVAGSHSPMMLP
jgi:hypothetical protein